MKKILWALACAALLFASCGEEAPGLVKVRSGKVQGVVTEGLTIYKGIYQRPQEQARKNTPSPALEKPQSIPLCQRK